MLKTLLDPKADASLRVLVSACIVGIAITLVYSVWRIQLATVAIREGREYAVRRDEELWPIVREVRENAKHYRESIQHIDRHMDRQDETLARVTRFIERTEARSKKE